jgi:NAD(P)-dependent dehydrogenase (short-subunit alcohol dehydrogenase family)
MKELEGKVAIVTGSSRGIGRAIAERLGSAGATVVLSARSLNASVDGLSGTLSETAAAIEKAGGKAIQIACDVENAASRQNLIDQTIARAGRIDILVNNAGISGSATNDLLDSGLWERVMAVNSTGVFLGTAAAVRQMQKNGGGSIVNLSSIAGIIGSEHVHMAYNASKAAVRLMTKSVAVQHARDRIRANSVHPGIMPPMRTSGRTADPAVRAERMHVIPMRRPGEIDEVAFAILFLASDESSYITGSEIHVDGGAIAI